MRLTFLRSYFPSEYLRGPEYLVCIGLIALVGMSLLKIGFLQQAGDAFQNVLVLSFLLAFPLLRINPLKERTFQLFLLAGAIPYLEFLFSYCIDPVTALKYWEGGGLYRLLLFLPLAWWLGGRAENGLYIYATALAGLILAVLFSPDFVDDFNLLLELSRVDFGMRDAQHTGMLFGAAFIGVVVFRNRISSLAQYSRWQGHLVLFVLTSFVLMGVLASQARATWLGLLCIGVVYILLTTYRIVIQRESMRIMAGLAPLIIVVMTIVVWQYDSIEARITTQSTTFLEIAEMEVDQLPYDSIGIRIHYWAESLKWISQKPLTGWGYGVRTKFIKESEGILESVRLHGPQHVHSSYLALLLSYGFIGFAFVIYLFVFLIRRARMLYMQGQLPQDIYYFSLSFTLFFSIVNFFESFLFTWTGIFLMGIVFAPIYTLSIKQFIADEYPEKLHACGVGERSESKEEY